MTRGKLCRRGLHDDWSPSGECRPCKNAAQRRQARTPNTHRFKRNHGLEAPGEAKRAADQRLARTPDSYRYDRVHGIGDAGETKHRADRRYNHGAPFAALIYDIQERAKARQSL